jgi:dolichyl-phosphate beta-glucosyltransferase
VLFPAQHVERWAFDVELLWMAQQRGIALAEVPVNWREIAGSKLDPLSASIEMMLDMLRVKFAYMLGIWKVWPE